MAHPRLILIGVVAVLVMSAVPVLIKATEANAYTIGIARLGIAVLAFMPLVVFRGHLLRLSGRQWLQLMVIGVVFGLHWLSYFFSIKLATAAIAALTILTYSVQYLVLAYLFNGEKVAPAEWLAIGVCFAGCVIVSPEFSLENDVSLGIAVGLLSALLYAAMPLLHQRASDIGTLERTWGQFFFALLLFLPLWGRANWDLQMTDVYQLLVLGLLCTVVSHGLWVKASTELPAIYASMIYYLYLPGALIGSAIFLGEPMTPVKVAGCALVLGSSAALSLYRYRRGSARD
ncbi:DMT family transporter [Seongchinamella sediminis]|uniref:DMT family transporter n=1 Tax=Seongchinamella sediminis TaxID=2283635 RepID=A0A3L7DW59_9GAMM|nr:DMT family transporter [Seongchinamella sediminis]RLQ21807.1 DMT family transporter [Seongchinamella sediminis]